MSFLRKEAEKLVKCPLNERHLVRSSRLEIHLMKCCSSNPGFEICPFDFKHRFKQQDRKQHVEDCSSRHLVQHLLPGQKPVFGSYSGNRHGDVTETPILTDHSKVNCEDEDWDEEIKQAEKIKRDEKIKQDEKIKEAEKMKQAEEIKQAEEMKQAEEIKK